MIDLEHNETVSKIKLDVYVDRQQFLKKLIKIEDETIKPELENGQLMQQNDHKKNDINLVIVQTDEERSRKMTS